MAFTVTTAGLDYMANILLKDGESPSSLWLGLFTGGTGTTCPAASATRAAMGAPFAEAATGSTYPGYVAVEILAAEWGTIGAQIVNAQTVRGAIAAQQSFAAATGAAGSANLTGFFLATAVTAGTVLLFANFDGGAADVIASLALGDIVRVTPTFGLASA